MSFMIFSNVSGRILDVTQILALFGGQLCIQGQFGHAP